MSRLSELSTLALIIVFRDDNLGDPWSQIPPILESTTRLLEHVPRRTRMREVWMQFELPTIATLGGLLSRGGPSWREACTALEDALLLFPSALDVQFRWSEYHRRRAGRPAFWSPTISSAFPKLNKQGFLTLPHSKSKLDLPDRKELITSIPKHTLQTHLATKSV